MSLKVPSQLPSAGVGYPVFEAGLEGLDRGGGLSPWI
jgi:hypothetical protein